MTLEKQVAQIDARLKKTELSIMEIAKILKQVGEVTAAIVDELNIQRTKTKE